MDRVRDGRHLFENDYDGHVMREVFRRVMMREIRRANREARGVARAYLKAIDEQRARDEEHAREARQLMRLEGR